jgi:hypothetical protein
MALKPRKGEGGGTELFYVDADGKDRELHEAISPRATTRPRS